MIFDTFLMAALAASASAVTIPSTNEISPRQDKGVSLKWYPYTTCNSAGGPWHYHGHDSCISLTSTMHGFGIKEMDAGCKVWGYEDGNCDEYREGAEWDQLDTCFSLQGLYSLKVNCD